MTNELKQAIEEMKERSVWMKKHFPESKYSEAIDTVVREYEKSTTPKEIEDARKFIRECHADIGFMGSPEYYEKRKMLEEWEKRGETTK